MLSLSHARFGSGPPLLLVHGIGHSQRGFAEVAPRLADAFETYAIDLPGFGDSAPLERPTMRALADACAAFMAEQGHERFHVAGNSLGGGIALHLALDGRALSACPLSPVGFMEGWERPFAHVSLLNARVADRVAGPLLRGPGRVGTVRRAIVRQFVEHGERQSSEDWVVTFAGVAAAPGFIATLRRAINWRCPAVNELPCPVTVAWAEHDRLLPTGPQSARARERLPSATHVTLRDCGHLPMLDDPELVAATIRSAATPR